MADEPAGEVEQSRVLLGNVLAAIEAGELEASPAQVGAIIGALEVLNTLR